MPCSIIDIDAYLERKQNNFYYNIKTGTHRKINTKFSTPHFKCSQILILGNWAQIPQITSTDTWKVIQSKVLASYFT